MPTPNTELNQDVEINSLPMNVDTNSDNILSDIILMNSSDANVVDFDNIPIDFDSSNSSIGTIESMEESLKLETNLPILTDIAEETVYETEFFDETLNADEKCEKTDEQLDSENFIVQSDDQDMSSILLDNSVLEFDENTADNAIDCNSINENDILCETLSSDTNNRTGIDDNSNGYNSQTNTNIGNNEFYFASSSSNVASTTDVSNLITISNNTNMASGLIKNISSNKISSNRNSNVNVGFVTGNVKNNVYPNISNVIRMNSVNNNNKFSTLKPYAIQSTSKFVPISIAPVNPGKRPANVSVGQPATNVLTKVLVSQGKVGQPFVFTNSSKPKSLCVVPNTSSGSSPVKSITAAQAKQMGIKLQPIRPSTTKTLKQKIIISSGPPGAHVLKKIHPIPKPVTPTKILPAPLVSKSASTALPTKIYVTQDYVMKAGTLITKQTGNQVITISNLQSAPVVSNHVSPKKQVQYIKLINNVGSTNVPTVASAKSKVVTPVTQNSCVSKIDKDTPIIVASSNIAATNLNIKGTNSVQTSKAVAPAGITVLPVLPSNVQKPTPGQRLILPAVSMGKAESVNQSSITEAKQIKTPANIVVLHEDVLAKIKGEMLSNPVNCKEDTKNNESIINHDNQDSIPSAQDFKGGTKSPTKLVASAPVESGNGLRSRKPCNCTRSQCLKLYCECFANGEFCNNCNCVSCHNNISHEENRQNAIKSCLDRNPQAFRPKIGKCLVGQNDRRHTKGCHCKRSGCLKNYCECYEAQIPCSENCKCVGCKNIDEMLFATSYPSSCSTFEKTDSQLEFQTFSKNKLTAEINDAVGQSGSSNPRHAFSFIKDQVVEATCQCLLAQADEVKRRNINVEDGKKYILEEFGRCLIQIIECAPDKYVPS